MGIGPDLTGASSRYTLRDMLENIIEPSKVISDQYGSTQFKMKDGAVVVDRHAGERKGFVHVMTNPFSPDSNVQLKSAEIANTKPFAISPMPPGLVNSLNPDELSDLIAYIFSAGDANHAYFAPPMHQVELAGAKSLFNGKDLSGWRGNSKLWSVKDGVIHGNTHGNPLKGNTFLILEGDDVEDFHLVYEARCAGNNSGVMYRSEVVDEDKFVMKGYQADLHPNPPYLAMIYEEKGRGILSTRGQTMVIDEAGKKKVTAGEKPEPVDASQWQTYEVICKGKRIIHKLNGKVAIDLVDNFPKRIGKGKIGLQLHAGSAMTADFRNIRLKRE